MVSIIYVSYSNRVRPPSNTELKITVGFMVSIFRYFCLILRNIYQCRHAALSKLIHGKKSIFTDAFQLFLESGRRRRN